MVEGSKWAEARFAFLKFAERGDGSVLMKADAGVDAHA